MFVKRQISTCQLFLKLNTFGKKLRRYLRHLIIIHIIIFFYYVWGNRKLNLTIIYILNRIIDRIIYKSLISRICNKCFKYLNFLFKLCQMIHFWRRRYYKTEINSQCKIHKIANNFIYNLIIFWILYSMFKVVFAFVIQNMATTYVSFSATQIIKCFDFQIHFSFQVRVIIKILLHPDKSIFPWC